MTVVRRRITRAVAVLGGLALVGLGMQSAQGVVPPPAYTCTGGSVTGGTYSAVTVAGTCYVDDGNVTVDGNFTVNPGATLIAITLGSNLYVTGSFNALPNSIVVLGCEPEEYSCNNSNASTGIRPQQEDTTDHVILGDVNVSQGLAFIAHANTFGRDVSQSGGGGGVNCNLFPPVLEGNPVYSDWEDNTIARNASIDGLQTCYLAFIRNDVGGTLNYNQNINADPDGNEVVTNDVTRNEICEANLPAVQFGDSGGTANSVGGLNIGQCPSGLLK